MRFLLDTNILIPLEDSKAVLKPSLSRFIQLASSNGHALLYHPASEQDIQRDTDENRRSQTLARIKRYQRLENPPDCPWNTSGTSANDVADNEILYALERNAVHALVTEDRLIHTKAKQRGIGNRVYYIQTAEEWLKRLHSEEPLALPNIKKINLYELEVEHEFFDTLRASYERFNTWFNRAAQNGRKAWMYGEDPSKLEALCIYAVQNDERITDKGAILNGKALKLCTLKVGEAVRGRKIGELFLKAAFRYATSNEIENIFITAKSEEYHLLDLLVDFGFVESGSYRGDVVYVKPHPILPPKDDLATFEFHQRYFPHFRDDEEVQKFIVPIKPQYHTILFPDYEAPQEQLQLGLNQSHVGNAIKLAYLCHAQVNSMKRGDIVLFYRSTDLKALTSLGIVESFSVSNDSDEVASMVSRRTVYNLKEIKKMTVRKTKVILFRLVRHFEKPIKFDWLIKNGIVNGYIRSIQKIADDSYREVVNYAR